MHGLENVADFLRYTYEWLRRKFRTLDIHVFEELFQDIVWDAWSDFNNKVTSTRSPGECKVYASKIVENKFKNRLKKYNREREAHKNVPLGEQHGFIAAEQEEEVGAVQSEYVGFFFRWFIRIAGFTSKEFTAEEQAMMEESGHLLEELLPLVKRKYWFLNRAIKPSDVQCELHPAFGSTHSLQVEPFEITKLKAWAKMTLNQVIQ